MHYVSEETVKNISLKAQSFRIDVLKMVYDAQSGHIGGAFSAAEIVASLVFQHMRLDPKQPDWPDRDRLLLKWQVSRNRMSGLSEVLSTSRSQLYSGRTPLN